MLHEAIESDQPLKFFLIIKRAIPGAKCSERLADEEKKSIFLEDIQISGFWQKRGSSKGFLNLLIKNELDQASPRKKLGTNIALNIDI